MTPTPAILMALHLTTAAAPATRPALREPIFETQIPHNSSKLFVIAPDGRTGFTRDFYPATDLGAIVVAYWPQWLAVVVTLVTAILVWRLWRLLRHRRTVGVPYCRACGYRVEGVASPACPECGQSLAGRGTVLGKPVRLRAAILLTLFALFPLGYAALHWFDVPTRGWYSEQRWLHSRTLLEWSEKHPKGWLSRQHATTFSEWHARNLLEPGQPDHVVSCRVYQDWADVILFTPDGRTAVTTDLEAVTCWDLPARQRVARYELRDRYALELPWSLGPARHPPVWISEDGRALLIGYFPGTALSLDLWTGVRNPPARKPPDLHTALRSNAHGRGWDYRAELTIRPAPNPALVRTEMYGRELGDIEGVAAEIIAYMPRPEGSHTDNYVMLDRGTRLVLSHVRLQDGSFGIWELPSGRVVDRIPPLQPVMEPDSSRTLGRIAIDPSERIVFIQLVAGLTRRGEIHAYDLAARRWVAVLHEPKAQAESGTYRMWVTPDGQRLVHERRWNTVIRLVHFDISDITKSP